MTTQKTCNPAPNQLDLIPILGDVDARAALIDRLPRDRKVKALIQCLSTQFKYVTFGDEWRVTVEVSVLCERMLKTQNTVRGYLRDAYPFVEKLPGVHTKNTYVIHWLAIVNCEPRSPGKAAPRRERCADHRVTDDSQDLRIVDHTAPSRDSGLLDQGDGMSPSESDSEGLNFPFSPEIEGLNSEEIEKLRGSKSDFEALNFASSGSSSSTGSCNKNLSTRTKTQEQEPSASELSPSIPKTEALKNEEPQLPLMADDLDLDCDDPLRFRVSTELPWSFLFRWKSLVEGCDLTDPAVVQGLFGFCVRYGALPRDGRIAFFAEASFDAREAKKKGFVLKENVWLNRRWGVSVDLDRALRMINHLDSGAYEAERRERERLHAASRMAHASASLQHLIMPVESDPFSHPLPRRVHIEGDFCSWPPHARDAEKLRGLGEEILRRERIEQAKAQEKALERLYGPTLDAMSDNQILDLLSAQPSYAEMFSKSGRRIMGLLRGFLLRAAEAAQMPGSTNP